MKEVLFANLLDQPTYTYGVIPNLSTMCSNTLPWPYTLMCSIPHAMHGTTWNASLISSMHFYGLLLNYGNWLPECFNVDGGER